jgi:regulation of enolase protein 1 (concanavalin A-like superfamily)
VRAGGHRRRGDRFLAYHRVRYIRDNGHLDEEQLSGDFDLWMRVRGSRAAQYDQARAMVRVDEHGI